MDEIKLYNPSVEMIVVGSCYKKVSEFLFSCIHILKTSDFADSAMQFYYNFLTNYALEYSNEITEAGCNAFAMQNSGIFAEYKKFGGYKTISRVMSLAVSSVDELRRQVDILKKFALLRELKSNGYNIEPIMQSSTFNSLTAEDIANLIRGNLDSICNKTISGLDLPIDLSDSALSVGESFLELPEHGIDTPWEFINSRCCGLMRSDLLGIFALSNSGKGRSLVYLLTHLALCENATVALFGNEMLPESMRLAYHTTIFNSKDIQWIHGNELCIPEMRYKHGAYKGNDGEIIYRKLDINKQPIETVEQFKTRLRQESEEFRMVQDTLKWVEEQKGKFLFKNVSSDYSDESLERNIRQAVMIDSADVWAYDTLKNSGKDLSAWADLVKTATRLSELNQSLKTAAGIVTCQLADSAHDIKIENANSSYIASARHIYHLLDSAIVMLHCREEWKYDYAIKAYDPQYGEVVENELDPTKHYVFCNLIKNRRGDKGMFALEADLNLNQWESVGGILVPKKRG